jgi:hypothetical protein
LLNKPDLAIQALRRDQAEAEATDSQVRVSGGSVLPKKDNANALIHAQNALANASDSQKKSVEEFITKLQAIP